MCQMWEHTLPGTPEAVRAVRHWVETVLDDTPVDTCTTERVVYAASELATNAVRYTASGTAGGTVGLRLMLGTSRLRLEITDQGSPHAPMIYTPNPDDECGRGLWLVHLRCLRLYCRGDVSGRTVCVDIPWRTTPDDPDELGSPGHELVRT